MKYDILNEITETRIYCGFRENMIQVSTKPIDEVDFNWLGLYILEQFVQECIIIDIAEKKSIEKGNIVDGRKSDAQKA